MDDTLMKFKTDWNGNIVDSTFMGFIALNPINCESKILKTKLHLYRIMEFFSHHYSLAMWYNKYLHIIYNVLCPWVYEGETHRN